MDLAVQKHLEWLSFNLPTYISHHLHPQHREKAQRGGLLHLGIINGKVSTLKGGKTKSGGISDNIDNATVLPLLVLGDLYEGATRSLQLSNTSESSFHS